MFEGEERHEHGPEHAELLRAVCDVVAARPPRGLLLTTTTADAMRPTREHLRRVQDRHSAAWSDVLGAGERFRTS
ncbi:hypothetical protein [Kitasatospora griseola]